MKATYIDHMGTDLSVVNAARVSFKKTSKWAKAPNTEVYDSPLQQVAMDMIGERKLSDRDAKLINYLARHEHFSPFNHTFISMHVKVPIFVARQLVKHEYMPFNEVSRRYVDEEPEFYWPKVWRGKSADKKQGSAGEVDLPFDLLNQAEDLSQSGFEGLMLETYKDILDAGVAPEQARMILSQNTYTEWHWSGTLGAWAKMYNLRSKPDTQLETQEIAKQCGKLIEPLFPVSWKALTSTTL